MKAYFLFFLWIAAVVLLAACGGGAPAPAPTVVPSQPSATTAAPMPTQTPEPEPTETPTPAAGSGSATLELRVTSRPTGAVTSSLVTLRNIQVSASAAAGDGAWYTIAAEPAQFDLLKLDGVEDVLGTVALEPGRYRQLRFDVTEAVLTIRGNVRPAEVPGETLTIAGEFDLEAGSATVLTLDFDAEKSIAFRPGIGPQFEPVVALLVRRENQGPAEARTVGNLGGEATSPPTAASTSTSPNAVRVVLPLADNLQWMNFYVAQGAGFFADEGIDVRVVVPPMPDAVSRFMAMGMADVAVLPRPQYLESIAAGEPLLVFANLFSNDPINLVVRGEVAEERGVSPDMALADRLSAIRSLRVGVAPGPPNRLRVLLDSAGLDPERDIEMVILHGEEQNPAFGDGRVDALYAHTPYLERALVKQGAVLIANQSAGEVPELANRQIHVLATTQSYARSHPEVLDAVTKAIYRAQQLIRRDVEAAAEAIRRSEVQLQEPDGLDTIVALYAPAIPETPEVSAQLALAELELYFPEHRTPPDLRGVDLTMHFDNRFAAGAVGSHR